VLTIEKYATLSSNLLLLIKEKPLSKQNETDVLRIEIDMDRVLAD
jgi:hypothetical protein